MAGKIDYFDLCSFKLYFYNLCSFGEVKLFQRQKVNEASPGRAEIEPPSTSMLSGLNPFACRTLFCQSSAGFSLHTLMDNKLFGLCVETEPIIVL